MYTGTSTLEICRAVSTKGDDTLPSARSNTPCTYSLERCVHTRTSGHIQRGCSHLHSRRQRTKLWFVHSVEYHTARRVNELTIHATMGTEDERR